MQNSGVMWFSAIVLEIFAAYHCDRVRVLKGVYNPRV